MIRGIRFGSIEGYTSTVGMYMVKGRYVDIRMGYFIVNLTG